MTQNIIELLGILSITIAIGLNIISAPQQTETVFVEPTNAVTVDEGFCSQGGLLPPSVKPCDS